MGSSLNDAHANFYKISIKNHQAAGVSSKQYVMQIKID
jgi:hypothetical protein